MFTGLVEDCGEVASASRRGDAVVLTIRPTAMPVAELTLGESVAVSGVCLTVTETTADSFITLAGAETLRLTTIGALRAGSRVNLERALRAGDRMGGHLVQGHVDGVATLAARRDRGANVELDLRPRSELLRYIISKGSIALDGVSLTVNSVDSQLFSVAIIPHTGDVTTLVGKRVGEKLNVEVDIVGKYVEKLTKAYRS